jgi:hypothetical protein
MMYMWVSYKKKIRRKSNFFIEERSRIRIQNRIRICTKMSQIPNPDSDADP